jgi:hypothetical protein
VKHNLKNIALHLNKLHNINPQQYEDQFGRIPDDEVVIPELAGNSSLSGSKHVTTFSDGNNFEMG